MVNFEIKDSEKTHKEHVTVRLKSLHPDTHEFYKKYGLTCVTMPDGGISVIGHEGLRVDLVHCRDLESNTDIQLTLTDPKLATVHPKYLKLIRTECRSLSLWTQTASN
jgi:hypothetical protein